MLIDRSATDLRSKDTNLGFGFEYIPQTDFGRKLCYHRKLNVPFIMSVYLCFSIQLAFCFVNSKKTFTFTFSFIFYNLFGKKCLFFPPILLHDLPYLTAGEMTNIQLRKGCHFQNDTKNLIGKNCRISQTSDIIWCMLFFIAMVKVWDIPQLLQRQFFCWKSGWIRLEWFIFKEFYFFYFIGYEYFHGILEKKLKTYVFYLDDMNGKNNKKNFESSLGVFHKHCHLETIVPT